MGDKTFMKMYDDFANSQNFNKNFHIKFILFEGRLIGQFMQDF